MSRKANQKHGKHCVKHLRLKLSGALTRLTTRHQLASTANVRGHVRSASLVALYTQVTCSVVYTRCLSVSQSEKARMLQKQRKWDI
jgi:hypothetical protein